MKKQNYVSTSLGQFLNENRSITLTRKYGKKEPDVVGSRAPLRNQVLAFVSENVKVTKNQLRKFIADINEGRENKAAIGMWLNRNVKYFITESRNGLTTYKLSPLGKKLAFRLTTESAINLSESKVKSRTKKKKDFDFKDEKTGEKGITDEEDDGEVNESKKDRIQKIIKNIKRKRKSAKLYEAEDEDEETETSKEETDEDVDSNDEDVDSNDEDVDSNDEAGTDDSIDVDDDTEGDDERVEITEFVITVDDVAAAIEELGDLGVEASEVTDDLGGEEDLDMDADLGGEEDLDMDADLGGEEVADEMGDIDLGLDGDIEGEEVEESVTGMEKEEKAKVPNLVEDTDELSNDDLDMEEEPFEEPIDDLADDDLADDDLADDDLGELPAEEEGSGQQIKVDASNWKQLKSWLESEGVDVTELFGGDIEVDGEEADEDDINFDDLEELPAEDGEGENGDDDEEEANGDDDEEEAKGDDDEEAKGDDTDSDDDKPEPGKKGVNPFEKK